MSTLKKPLKFIHITKCAGTSIETAAKKVNIEWGMFHSEYGFHHNLFPSVPRTVIDKYDWFMVVRNPYTRILSEYHCKWGGIGNLKPIPKHTQNEMNEYLIKKINKLLKKGNHYTEQSLYLHPTVPIHIIKFENLQEEFDALMRSYDITGVVLGHDNTNPKLFTLSDFSKELIELINTVYDKDFSNFGYEKMTV